MMMSTDNFNWLILASSKFLPFLRGGEYYIPYPQTSNTKCNDSFNWILAAIQAISRPIYHSCMHIICTTPTVSYFNRTNHAGQLLYLWSVRCVYYIEKFTHSPRLDPLLAFRPSTIFPSFRQSSCFPSRFAAKVKSSKVWREVFVNPNRMQIAQKRLLWGFRLHSPNNNNAVVPRA